MRGLGHESGDVHGEGARPAAGERPGTGKATPGAGHTSPGAGPNQRRSPPPRRKEGAEGDAPRGMPDERGGGRGIPRKRIEKAAANEPGGVSKSEGATDRAGRARSGTVGAGSRAGAQHALLSHAQPRHDVVGWTESPGSKGGPEATAGIDATTACPRKTRSRTMDWKVRVTGGRRPGLLDSNPGRRGLDYFSFAIAASSFLANLAVSFLKSFMQPLQQNMNSRPSTTAPTASSFSSASPDTMQVVSG